MKLSCNVVYELAPLTLTLTEWLLTVSLARANRASCSMTCRLRTQVVSLICCLICWLLMWDICWLSVLNCDCWRPLLSCADCCQLTARRMHVRWLLMSVVHSYGHMISKTEQDRPVVTMEHCYGIDTADSVATFRSPKHLLSLFWEARLRANFLSQWLILVRGNSHCSVEATDKERVLRVGWITIK